MAVQVRADPTACARAILEVVPAAMDEIRREMREIPPAGLSVSQFRTLEYVHRHPGTSLSPVAERLGVRMPSASGLVDRLVGQGRLRRDADPDERRRIRLWPTALGEAELLDAQERTAALFRVVLAQLAPAEVERLALGMASLERLLERLAPEPAANDAAPSSPVSNSVPGVEP